MDDNLKRKVLSLSNNGIITTKSINQAGFHRNVLSELCNSGEIEKISKGIYLLLNEWQDELFTLQMRYKRGVFSHSTALFLLGYSERTPLVYDLTFPTNYNNKSLESKNVKVRRVIDRNYQLGLTKIKTPYGNIVKTYDIERCICDILKGNNTDMQIIQFVLKKYVLSKEKDINKLMYYSKRLRVESKVRKYMEILL